MRAVGEALFLTCAAERNSGRNISLEQSVRKEFMMSFASTPATAINPWIQILAALEKKVNRQSFETWLKPTRYSHIAGRTLYVRIPTEEFQHIGDKYSDLIQEAIDLLKLDLDDPAFVTAERDP